MDVPQLELSDWTSILKIYQKTSMNTLLQNNAEEDAAKLWLSANGVSTTKQFGGGGSPDPFWDRFASELQSLFVVTKNMQKNENSYLHKHR